MKFNHHIKDNVCIMRIEGEILRQQIDKLETHIRQLLEIPNVEAFIVNLKKMTYLSSPGVGLLMTFYKRVQKLEKGFGFCHLDDEVQQTFKATKLDLIVKIYDTEEEAIAAQK
ncbi:MAG: STAS domain-containing protein [SAR324 cluster bacterium]|nr:STAS domain-containing protein [SAR324 cluster bacterium]